jgi:hypothetical protein
VGEVDEQGLAPAVDQREQPGAELRAAGGVDAAPRLHHRHIVLLEIDNLHRRLLSASPAAR